VESDSRSFAMKDKDIIDIANSASDQIGKFLGLVGLVTSPVISGAERSNEAAFRHAQCLSAGILMVAVLAS
jgi:hypothetical protein